ncbi:MAG: hypothetical protein V3S89_15120 [Desulfobacterales bacterium]
MPKVYRTIILGAGPAGLNAARFIQGDSLVLDRKKEVGLPIRCGEGLSLHALERESLPIQSEWVNARIRQIKRIMPNGKHWGNPHEAPYALIVNKEGFEKYLAGMISSEIVLNAHIVDIKREGDLWKITTSGNDIYRGEYIVGADGPSSLTAKTIFDYTYTLVPGINYEVTFERPVVKDELQMYFGEKLAPKGYGWIFPYSTYTANIGLLIKTGGKPKGYYERFLEDIVRPLYGQYQLGKQKSGTMPINGFPVSVVKDNALLVGDAGAFTDPIFSGGISLAMLTGRLAADSINDDCPDHYQESIDALPFTGKTLSRAQEIFYGFDDETLNQLGEVLHGKSTSYINTEEGQKDFMSKPALRVHMKDVAEFAKTWKAAKEYLW